MKRMTRDELLEAIRLSPAPPEIVAQRLVDDLTTPTVEGDPDGLASFGCLNDSGAGRCDGAYKHKGRLHYRVVGDTGGETWELPW